MVILVIFVSYLYTSLAPLAASGKSFSKELLIVEDRKSVTKPRIIMAEGKIRFR